MTQWGWMFVILVVSALAYDILRRAIGNAPRKNFAELEKAFNEHVEVWDGIALQWRAKVQELEQKCERVVTDAKNELAGTLAAANDAGQKGWR